MPKFKLFQREFLWFLSLTLTALAFHAEAAPIFSQTDTNQSFDGRLGSDRDSGSGGSQKADDVMLSAPATARSATWWGIFSQGNTPVLPVKFELIFYADKQGLPDLANVISRTSVSFNSLSDTGETYYNGVFAPLSNIYEFKANLTPTALSANTRVWFSVLADTSNDPDDNFSWRIERTEVGEYSAGRINLPVGTAFSRDNSYKPLFSLDNAANPDAVFPDITVSSFRSLGSGTFELSLKGAAGTVCRLYSSPSLDFTPGALVTNLTKGDAGDPGTISGLGSSIVTTDGAGNAKVRMNFTEPKNFVLVRSNE